MASAEAVGNIPERFRAMMKSDGAKWAGVIKAANIKPE